MDEKEEALDTTIASMAPGKLEALKDVVFRDFEVSGSKHVEAATKFQAGLDKVVDVLLILVLKFGRASTMLLVLGLLNVACVITIIVTTVQIAVLRSEVGDLMDRQEEFAKSQKRIEKTTTETKQDVATTSQKVSETQAKVETAVEAAPKVELDARTGKAKLVVPVPPKPSKKPTAPAGSGRKIEVRLE